MLRFLVLLGIALFVAYLISDRLGRLRRALASMRSSALEHQSQHGLRRGGKRGGELVPCARCGVHVPRGRSVWREKPGLELPEQSDIYCSEACRRSLG